MLVFYALILAFMDNGPFCCIHLQSYFLGGFFLMFIILDQLDCRKTILTIYTPTNSSLEGKYQI